MEAKEIIHAIDTYLVDKFKRINLYLIPQYLLLIELYYLLLNYFINFMDSGFIVSELGFNPVSTYIPEVVLEYNNLIMMTLLDWYPFLMFLSIGLLVSSIFIQFTKGIVVFRNHDTFLFHSSYGSSVSYWFLFMGGSVFFYSILGYWFPLIFIVLLIVSLLKDEIKKRLNKKITY